MRVAFRVDASIEIGSGHVMRCLTLAQSLRDRGSECIFICREHKGNMLSLIREKGFEGIGLPTFNKYESSSDTDEQNSTYMQWLGDTPDRDCELSLCVAGDELFDWLIVDHYGIESNWEKSFKSRCNRVFVIDDLANRRHECNLLLDQNLGVIETDYRKLIPADCQVLIGPKYALLRPEFAFIREFSICRRRELEFKHILISMGGVDKDNVTEIVLNLLAECDLPAELRITVVMGKSAPWIDRVRSRAKEMPWPTSVLVDHQKMAELMAHSDLAIGASGSTAWERCCLGLPSIMMVLAENQQRIASELEKIGAAKLVELATVSHDLKLAVESMKNTEQLNYMQHRASAVTVGAGAKLVAERLLCA